MEEPFLAAPWAGVRVIPHVIPGSASTGITDVMTAMQAENSTISDIYKLVPAQTPRIPIATIADLLDILG